MGERPSFWLLPLFLSSRAWGQVDEGGKGERFTQSKGFSITCNVLADNTPIDKVRKIIWTVEQPPSNYFGKHRPPPFCLATVSSSSDAVASNGPSPFGTLLCRGESHFYVLYYYYRQFTGDPRRLSYPHPGRIGDYAWKLTARFFPALVPMQKRFSFSYF